MAGRSAVTVHALVRMTVLCWSDECLIGGGGGLLVQRVLQSGHHRHLELVEELEPRLFVLRKQEQTHLFSSSGRVHKRMTV